MRLIEEQSEKTRQRGRITLKGMQAVKEKKP